MEVKAVFHMDGGRPAPSRDPFDLTDAVFALDASILEDRADLRVPFDDRPSDGLSMGPQCLRDLDHGDVADDVERTRQRGAKGGRDADNVLVGSDREESLLELRLFGGEAEVRASTSWQPDRIAVRSDSQGFQEKVLFQEHTPD